MLMKYFIKDFSNVLAEINTARAERGENIFDGKKGWPKALSFDGNEVKQSWVDDMLSGAGIAKKEKAQKLLAGVNNLRKKNGLPSLDKGSFFEG